MVRLRVWVCVWPMVAMLRTGMLIKYPNKNDRIDIVFYCVRTSNNVIKLMRSEN